LIILDVHIAVSVSLLALNKRYGQIQKTQHLGGAVWEEGLEVVCEAAVVLDEGWAVCEAGVSKYMHMA